MTNYNFLFDAEAAVQEVVPRVVERHRAKGILTWSLLHKLEEEVLSEVSSSARFSKRLLEMICAPAALSYPNDDRPASFEGHEFVPIVFGAIEKAWRQVH
ncbi:hypothetical protein PTKU46_88180 [Paraburkholderia terrae]|uniref:DUF2471 family protein n=1 Tax=Paraburkholderia terrae TaxID=311230 RepID=UPI0030E00843